MVTFELTHDLAKLDVFLTQIHDKAVKKAVARSIARTFTGVKKQFTRSVRTERLINTRSMPVKQVKRKFLREKKNTRAAAAIPDMFARMDFSDRRPSLRHFYSKRVVTGRTSGGRPLHGVQVQVMGRKYQTGRGFVPKGKGKTYPILARTTKARKPLRKLFGPSFAIMVRKMRLVDGMQAEAGRRYSAEFERNLRFFLGRMK